MIPLHRRGATFGFEACSLKRMKLTRSFFLPFTLLFTLGCSVSNAPSNGVLRSDGIMPLAVGNKWIGQVTSYDVRGVAVSTHFDTLSVYGTEAVNGETWFYVRGF